MDELAQEVPMKEEGPKVTDEEVANAIVEESYTVLPDGKTTVCQLTLDNGFTVEGMSACVSPQNFDPVKGNRYSRQRALDKVWLLLGFRLQERLWRLPKAVPRTEQDLAYPSKPVEAGDQVLFYERLENKVSDPMVAIVAKVLSVDHVALSILAPNGTMHARDSVGLVYPWQDLPLSPFYACVKR